MSHAFTDDAAAATAAAADRTPPRRDLDPAAVYIPVKAAELSALIQSLTAQARMIAKICEHLGIDAD